MSERLARRLYALLVFAALPLSALVLTNKADPDLWMHLLAGKLMVATRSVPRVDPFSFSIQGRPWVDHEWLFQWLAYLIFSAFGSAGLMVAKGLVGAGTMFCLYRAGAARAESLPVRAFVFLLSSAVVICLGFTVRPQIFTLLGCALIVMIHQLSRKGGPRWSTALDFAPWLLVPWSWFHGGFAAGAALFGLIAIGEAVNGRLRGRMLVNLLLGLGATAYNPYGFALWGKVYEMITGSALSRFILEWRPVWASGVGLYRGGILLFGLLLAVAFAGDDSRRENASEWLLAGAGLLASVLSVRHLLLLGILAVPALAIGFEKLRLRSAKASGPHPLVLKVFAGSVLALFGVLAFWIFYEVPVREGVPLGALVYGEKEPGWLVYPKGAADFLNERGFAGRVWSDASVGGYLVWHLNPASRIFVDGRTDLYTMDVLTDYANAMAGSSGWEHVVTRWAPDLLLLPVGAPLAAAAEGSGAWHAVYRDPDYVALERGAGGAAEVSPRPALPWLFP